MVVPIHSCSPLFSSLVSTLTRTESKTGSSKSTASLVRKKYEFKNRKTLGELKLGFRTSMLEVSET